jgi:hypothetical protein
MLIRTHYNIRRANHYTKRYGRDRPYDIVHFSNLSLRLTSKPEIANMRRVSWDEETEGE